MKKLLILFLLTLQSLVSKPILAVSIPMQEEFIQKIAGMEYEIISLVEKGVNPHDFEPKFSSIKKVNEAIAYFSIGIEFEDSWLKRFKQQNPQMQIFPSNAGIDFINFAQNTHHHENHSHDNGDKHIWLSISNVKQIATNLYKALSTLNPQKDYSKAYEALIIEIKNTDKIIKENLKNLPKGQKFVVFHPMLGYFAKDYNLEEISIEVEGKSPKMKEMMKVINTIKKENLKIIFAQPEFSTKAAEFIAQESGAKLGYFSPLQTPWAENLIDFSKTLKAMQE
ncbi:metal ABC transporter solute-binding protein, Zn/Mn family [Helicobacter pullorum]|uniref:metal ABC transporter solute-binding protein, Zn/Mn family n=1 Tax=Helicobacter pullorum TaxID=35818 RepID=UPI001DBFFA4E|nr:zinc ABC transporter substrate-binding protein [Helicobacter pullorum]HJF83883.1 zinc ABC transporter substrate-binding protein [Helicobacter pullorum]